MKNYLKNGWPLAGLPKLDLRMKLSLLMLFTTLLSLNAKEGYSQRTKLSLDVENATVKQIIDEIETTTEFKFIYKTKDVNLDRKTTIKVHKVEIEKILNRLFEATDTEYLVRDRQILLRAKKEVGLNEQVLDKENDIAQQWINVSGIVSDNSGVPLTGVTVMAVGTSIGVSTDFEGRYSIRVSGDVKELSFSYLGYKTQVIVLADVSNLSGLNISMTEEASKLEEVVVFADGYTKISEERATGSYGTVPTQMLENYATQSVGSMLEGVSPGIQVVEDADGNVNIEDVSIRGVGTIDSNATPLVVVDGFPISGGFNTVNPNIIESITVLKDAAAASIWGARASNGVIVITTKKGKQDEKLRVTFSSFMRLRDKMDLSYNLDKASAATELEMERYMFQEAMTAVQGRAYINFGDVPIYNNVRTVYSQGGRAYFDYAKGNMTQAELDATINRLAANDVYNDIDRYLLTSPLNKQYNLEVATGGDRSSTMLSVLYNDNINSFINDENDQLLINLNNSFKITNWAELQVGIVADRTKSKNSGLDISALDWLNRYDRLVDDNGDYLPVPYYLNMKYIQDFTANTTGLPYEDLTWNPIREANATEFSTKQNNFRISTALNLDLTKDLRLSSSFQYEDFVSKNTSLYTEESFEARYEVTNSINPANYSAANGTVSGNPNIPLGGIRSTTNGTMEAYVVRNTLAFNKDISNMHQINAFGGFELSSIENKSDSNILYGFNEETNSFAIPNYTATGGLMESYSGANYGVGLRETTQRFLSFFGNAAYTFNNKYTLTGSARADGANYIVKDKSSRYNPMWSVGLGWNIRRESFMEGVDFLDVWKVRATIGENGNIVPGASQVPIISLRSTPSSFTGTITGSISSQGNPNLRWERTRVFNLGTDFSLFEGFLSGSFDFYRKNSYDLIARIDIPSTLGSTVQSFNAAEMRNNGYEINLNANVDITNDLNWFSNIAFANNDSKTTKFNQAQLYPRSLVNGVSYPYVEGYAYQPMFSFVYGGVQDFTLSDGSVQQYPTIEGQNGQTYRWDENIGAAGEEGLTVVKYEGTRIAPTVVGWNNSFTFKGLTLRARMIGKFGHKFFRPAPGYATWATKQQTSYGSTPEWETLLSGEGAAEGLPMVPASYDFYTYRWGWYSPYLDTRVDNAAHIRLRELYLGYDLPARLMSSLGLANLRIFTQVENLGNIWTANDHGIDPEYLRGINRRPETSFTLGINLQF